MRVNMFRTIRVIYSGVFISLVCVSIGQAQVYEVLPNGSQTWHAAGGSQSPTLPITDTYGAVTLLVTGSTTSYILDGTALNSYTGGTIINGGATLSAPNDAALGNVNTAITLGDATTSGKLVYTNTSTDGAITSIRNFTLNAGGEIIVPSTYTTTLTGIISGTGGLTVGDGSTSGTLILSGINTYTGGTTVEANASLAITKDAALGTNPLILNGGTLQFVSSIDLLHNIQLSATTNYININSYNPIITPAITGSGGLTVYDDSATPGTLTLNGTNTYTGSTVINSGTVILGDSGSITQTSDTTINDGTLRIGVSTNSDATLTSPTVTVGSAGTLTGSGKIIGDVTSTGTISPGNGTSNSLTINGNYAQSGGTLLVNVYSSGTSLLTVNGTTTFTNSPTIKFVYDSSYIAPNSTGYKFFTTTSFSGTFTTPTVSSKDIPSATLVPNIVVSSNNGALSA